MTSRAPGWAVIAPTWILFALVMTLLIAESARTTQPAAAQDAGAVSIHDNFFDPTPTDIVLGATVVWTDAGLGQHTVSSDTGVFDSGQEKDQRLNPGQTFSFTFTQAGTYTYHCALHGAAGGVGMSGTVVVEAASPAPTIAAPTRTVDLTATPVTATRAPATASATPTLRPSSNVVTPTITAAPGNSDAAADGGGNDSVWILLAVGVASVALGAAAAVLYRRRRVR
jgi:plastocyanin